jgi:hypothetical protein
MICVNGVWTWVGEYYTETYKRQKGVVIDYYA